MRVEKYMYPQVLEGNLMVCLEKPSPTVQASETSYSVLFLFYLSSRIHSLSLLYLLAYSEYYLH